MSTYKVHCVECDAWGCHNKEFADSYSISARELRLDIEKKGWVFARNPRRELCPTCAPKY